MKTVLVVDDEHDILYALKGVLEDEGYEVVACSSGREALEYLSSARPHLVLMDVMMPVMSGLDVLEAIKQRPNLRELPVVMMSAVDPNPKQKSPAWRAFLRKPFTIERLIETVGAATKEHD